MKKLFICLVAAFVFYTGQSQQNNTVVVNPASHNEETLFKRMYQYPQFVTGKAFYKNGTITQSKFNYNCLTNQIIFISPNGDTLELLHGGDFSKIVISADTFCYYNKEFLQQVSHHPSYNLFVKHSLQYKGSERKGAYGTYSATSAPSSITEMHGNEGSPIKLSTDENIMYSFEDTYYISGRFGQFYPANKKGFYELFSKNEKKLKEFIEKNEINFKKKEDLEKLLDYARLL